MRIGITLEDERGLESNVSAHFGQCGHLLIADIEDNAVKNVQVVTNAGQHGGGGCKTVDALLKYDITHVIAGGMGAGAQNKFVQANVAVLGFSGKVKDAIAGFIGNSLKELNPAASMAIMANTITAVIHEKENCSH